jgi:hypothetical protein
VFRRAASLDHYVLFLLYVNELPQWIKKNIKMFADDTKIWKKLNPNKMVTGESLQKDLETLQDWTDKWLLKFNTEKCKVMQVGHELNTKYHMRRPESRIELEIIEEDKDLAVFTRSDLKSSTQCLKSAVKARKIVGRPMNRIIRQNFRRLNKRDFLLLYKTYVRPHLEYGLSNTHGDVEVIERVQRAATNLIPQLKK